MDIENSQGGKGKGATSLPPDERRCTAQGKDGERCKAWVSERVKRERGQALCAGHGGLGKLDPARAAAASAEARRSTAQQRRRRAVDVYRDAVERAAQEFVDARLAIIRDERAPASDRLRAMEQLEARALGRPTEHVETTVREPESLQAIHAMSREERQALLAQLDAEGRGLRLVEAEG